MGQYTQVDPIGLAGGNPTLHGYVYNPNLQKDLFGLFKDSILDVIDYIVTPNGTVVPTNTDINLVSTTTPTNQGGDWIQTHFNHTHDGMRPHTHYPERHSGGSTTRGTRPTTASDLDFADQQLKDGEMRPRNSRKDLGGRCP